MSDYTDGQSQCEAMRDELAELALGILTGRERSEVLSHVESCLRCTTELDHLSIVVDTVLQLGPEVEPPLGFELDLAQRLEGRTVHPTRHRRRISVLAAAAVIAVLLGFGLGTVTMGKGSSGHGPSTTANLTSANLTSEGHILGRVMVSTGSPAWVFMTVDGGTWSGSVKCTVTLVGGSVETIGVFKLSHGYGAWVAPLTSKAGHVRSAQLIAPSGDVVASAQFA